MTTGRLNERVAFDIEDQTDDGYGGKNRSWQETFQAAAEIIYERGGEATIAGGLTGTASWKVRIRAHAASRAVTTDHRMRDVRRGLAFNIREVDALSDRLYVWLKVDSGVAI
ncbi:phage head closure protein [Palleronia aestuarii]|uniref:phage head closure protein n=1 Tax=Palleronia aestuarii TaxID=568105 RepID=UPI001474AA31|nr:phage head closure protein [Palleronia aestuarii]